MEEFGKFRNKIKGDSGEIKAQHYLKKNKYKILETNFKNKLGEIDIVAEKGGVVIFVEVKSRLTNAYGRPMEAVDSRKQNKIKKVAEIYLMIKNRYYNDCRFDVIEVFDDKIEHIENAF